MVFAIVVFLVFLLLDETPSLLHEISSVKTLKFERNTVADILRLRLFNGFENCGDCGNKLEGSEGFNHQLAVSAALTRRHTSSTARPPSLLSTVSCSQKRRRLPVLAQPALPPCSHLSFGRDISQPIPCKDQVRQETYFAVSEDILERWGPAL